MIKDIIIKTLKKPRTSFTQKELYALYTMKIPDARKTFMDEFKDYYRKKV